MRQIDELQLNNQFAGSRILRDLLGQQGLVVDRQHIRTLIQRMKIETSIAGRTPRNPRPDTNVYPYLLRGLPSHSPTKSGPWISRTSRSRAASSIWPPWSIGLAVARWPGNCRPRWKRPINKDFHLKKIQKTVRTTEAASENWLPIASS